MLWFGSAILRQHRPFHTLLDTTPEIIEAHHVTGEDCFVLKVLARFLSHLHVAGASTTM